MGCLSDVRLLHRGVRLEFILGLPIFLMYTRCWKIGFLCLQGTADNEAAKENLGESYRWSAR